MGLLVFEVLIVYFIMPMPGSQEMNSIDVAYFPNRWSWVFRILFAIMILAGLFKSKWKRKWLLIIPIAIVAIVVFMANFRMAADRMFYQPNKLLLVNATENKVDSHRLVCRTGRVFDPIVNNNIEMIHSYQSEFFRGTKK